MYFTIYIIFGILIFSYTKINEIFTFWIINESYWFNTKTDKIDKIISHKFKLYLFLAEYNIISFWKFFPHGEIVLLIILDQFSRHIYRGNTTRIMKNTKKAFNISRKMIDNDLIKTKYNTINTAMWVMMPLRHLSKIEYLNECDIILFELQQKMQNNNKIWEKVKRANTMRLEKTKRENQFDDIKLLSFESILENPWNNNTTLCKQDSFQSLPIFKKIMNIMKKYINSKTCIIVSLSGGVDSMVLLRIILELFPDNTIVACHINYNIRNESCKEEQFLKYYTNLLLGTYSNLIIHTKKIKKFTHNWQEETRNIRFDFYKEIGNSYDNYIVLTGHIFDDLMENVLLNLFQGGTKSGGTNILSISGMNEMSLVRGISMIRPLLYIDKNELLHIAKIFDIPYFNDSSFILATRIRIRKELLPLLKEIFSSSDTRLKQITNSSIEVNKLIYDNIINPILDKHMHITATTYILDISSIINIHHNIFWNTILSEILLSNKYFKNTFMINNKCIQSFVSMLPIYTSNKHCFKKKVMACHNTIGIYLEKKDTNYYLHFSL